jgi:hypothetical protein
MEVNVGVDITLELLVKLLRQIVTWYALEIRERCVAMDGAIVSIRWSIDYLPHGLLVAILDVM